MFELWFCQKEHERVGWGPGGGYKVKDKNGKVKRIDDRRCWYCGAYIVLLPGERRM